MSQMFFGCQSLTIFPDIFKLDYNLFMDISEMFCGCKSLTSLPDISKWNKNINDISNKTNNNSLEYSPDNMNDNKSQISDFPELIELFDIRNDTPSFINSSNSNSYYITNSIKSSFLKKNVQKLKIQKKNIFTVFLKDANY